MMKTKLIRTLSLCLLLNTASCWTPTCNAVSIDAETLAKIAIIVENIGKYSVDKLTQDGIKVQELPIAVPDKVFRLMLGFSFAILGGVIIKNGLNNLYKETRYEHDKKDARKQIMAGFMTALTSIIYMHLNMTPSN